METEFGVYEWGRVKEQLRTKFPELSNADLVWGRTTRDDLIEMISTKLGKKKKT
ncbi:hypothetical protein [uncultured Draconibacterium sp.]|uniref:hypothetical protein n=1 Tax=uncultured Draconibacterium sp. TaxID=1573823 RepID=UPI0029C62483|nr:hypothetical protein [uncultured Draconibacterium sp.]